MKAKEKLKRCPECGNFFACLGNEDCWCENYQVHRKDMIKLLENYTDCICPDCLAKYAEK